MIKRISSGLVVFAGMVSLPSAVPQRQAQMPTPSHTPMPTQTPPVSDHRPDPRLICLQKFFSQANCPAVRLADIFIQAADENHLDWRLLPSLSFVETGGGKAALNNNLFGWASGQAHFDSWAAGIRQVGFHLAHRLPYRHKNTAQILAIYNPNAGYGQKVTSVMRQIAPTE